MGIKVALNHLTRYQYDREIALDPQVIRLRPAPHTKTKVNSYSLKIRPDKHFLNWQQDPFGNFQARCVFPKKTKLFEVEVDLIVDINVYNPFDFFLEESSKNFPFEYEPSIAHDLTPYLEKEESGPLLKQLLKTLPGNPVTIDHLVGLNVALNQSLNYVLRMEPGVQTCEKTLELKSGSCRDMAYLLCQILRHQGLASRFVSGYLIQLTADQKALKGPTGPLKDFTDLHAWTEVYLPGAGWIGLDPTSGLVAGEGHIPLCATPNPTSAAPISGTLEDCQSDLQHSMSVTRLEEDYRATQKFPLNQRRAFLALGETIQKILDKDGAQLTQGGEPTFVSDTNRSGAEWNFTATSYEKEKIGKELLGRIGKRISSNSFIYRGQGKWYPGEVLPRWSYNCYWRKDQEPISHLSQNSDSTKNLRLSDVRKFLELLCDYLGITTDFVHEAHEDETYYRWKKGQISRNEDSESEFEQLEKERLLRLETEGLQNASGLVLPLKFSYRYKRWISNHWTKKNQRLTLTPGDSRLGLRLPMSTLPYVDNPEIDPDKSPFEKTLKLPSFSDFQILGKQRKQSLPSTTTPDLPIGYVRTALCVEIVDKELVVFCPPTSRLEHFLDLIQCIGQVSSDLNYPIVVEGYDPPMDPRIETLKVTPDPGVLEVNIHPSKTWSDLVQTSDAMYQSAYESGLSAIKFRLDGKVIGTEGGNHIILGSENPSESPFLKRPDLLRSFITYWQNHPALSYLFSSTYVGPTSQSPRIDEARNDSLYELEISFQQLELEKNPSYWIIDRLLRNILIDSTGNTHRTEFSIDKLYSPDSERGRLGLLELRCFEMPPNSEMFLLQSLLIRALFAWFWKTPYKEPLVRFGTQLHDRFMLPHYIWEDFGRVIQDLNLAGFEFQKSWYQCFYEFRFPKYGSLRLDGVDIELRSALEPWHVLGEEIFQGATSRAVDSSVERLQVSAKNLHAPYLVLTCNKRIIPLKSGDIDTKIGAVRYKAWSPPSSLHPTIAVQSPLVFDLVDIRHQRSLGGCQYHVIHPGGRSYSSAPVNDNEAQGRRLERFEPGNHSTGTIQIKEEVKNPDFPHTLDLRYLP